MEAPLLAPVSAGPFFGVSFHETSSPVCSASRRKGLVVGWHHRRQHPNAMFAGLGTMALGHTLPVRMSSE